MLPLALTSSGEMLAAIAEEVQADHQTADIAGQMSASACSRKTRGRDSATCCGAHLCPSRLARSLRFGRAGERLVLRLAL